MRDLAMFQLCDVVAKKGLTERLAASERGIKFILPKFGDRLISMPPKFQDECY
jgi:hypothetical protein